MTPHDIGFLLMVVLDIVTATAVGIALAELG
jgi:hypothetical protein